MATVYYPKRPICHELRGVGLGREEGGDVPTLMANPMFTPMKCVNPTDCGIKKSLRSLLEFEQAELRRVFQNVMRLAE